MNLSMNEQTVESIKELIKSNELDMEEWAPSEACIEASAILIFGDKRPIISMDRLELFLYLKQVMATEYQPNRIFHFRDVVGGRNAGALQRLTSIVITGETNSSTRANFEPEFQFEKFLLLHPEWEGGDSFVIFRDHQHLKGKNPALVERVQLSGLCYMHAGVVLQHYLVAMANADIVPVLDMAKYLRQNASGKLLYNHIWEDEGGDSWAFFQSILYSPLGGHGFEPLHGNLLSTDDNLKAYLRLYGPALISGFSIVPEFMTGDYQHLGCCDTRKKIGSHAMILIGYRVEDKKTFYLIQNWWKHLPYVEVDLEYLQTSDAIVRFITARQSKMGDFKTNYDVMVECGVGIDACEKFQPER